MNSSHRFYIDFDSTYRNRSRDPNPANFTALISQSGKATSPFQALDAVSNGVITFPPPNSSQSYSYFYPIFDMGPALTTDTVFIDSVYYIDEFGNTQVLAPKSATNSYIGDVLEWVNADVVAPTFTQQFHTITGFRLVSSDTPILLQPSTSAASIVNAGTTTNVELQDVDNTPNINGYYIGKYIKMITGPAAGNVRQIIDYDGGNRIIYIDPSNPFTAAPAIGNTFEIYTYEQYQATVDPPFDFTGSAINYTYPATQGTTINTVDAPILRIRGDKEREQGILVSGGADAFEFELPGTSSSVDDYYRGNFIWITNEERVNTSDVAVATTPTTITLAATASAVNDFYNGMRIIMDDGTNQVFSIISDYVGATQVATVNPGFTGTYVPAGGDTYTIMEANPIFNEYRLISEYDGTTQIGEVTEAFSSQLQADDTYNILFFSEDNYNPYTYIGSNVAQNNDVCYQLELINLILPNVPLTSGDGSTIAFYPYVWVELNNINSSGGRNTVINTNSPTGLKALFKVPVFYISNPLTATFVALDGHGMVQYVKFKPNDSFQFRVLLPDGDVFQTEADNEPPIAPNPSLQVSVTFSAKRCICSDSGSCCSSSSTPLRYSGGYGA